MKKFKRRVGWTFLRMLTFINSVLPLGWSYFLGKVLGTFADLIIARHRRIALDSLDVAFPWLSLSQKKRIARDFFVFMSQSSFELLSFLRNPQQLENVRCQGLHFVQEALKKKRGIIIVTAHMGNFPLLSIKLAQEGYPVHFVTRPMRDERAGNYLYTLRTNAGVKTIFSYPRRECVNGILKALRENEIVIIQMDQNFGTGGVWVKFFGKLAATPVGAIVFALRTKAALIPAYTYRESKGKHCVRFFPEKELVVTENKDETVLLNTIAVSRMFEDWIRWHPSQWGWIHRRWKSQPSEAMKQCKFKVENELIEERVQP